MSVGASVMSVSVVAVPVCAACMRRWPRRRATTSSCGSRTPFWAGRDNSADELRSSTRPPTDPDRLRDAVEIPGPWPGGVEAAVSRAESARGLRLRVQPGCAGRTGTVQTECAECLPARRDRERRGPPAAGSAGRSRPHTVVSRPEQVYQVAFPNGKSTSGRIGRDRCCISVALPTSTSSLAGSGRPRSVLARVVVGFQCFITHRAVGECFVPAEQIGVGESGDGRADQRCQPEHP